jgi:hypothetical protein
MSSLRRVAAVGLGALVLVAIAAAPTRADKCTGAKLKAIGKKEDGLLGCQAKVAATNDSSGLAACEGKVMGKFAAAFAKAGTCAGDQTTCENVADGCESTVASAMTAAFPSPCEAAKRKAAGKFAKGELGCYSKAAAKGVPVDTVTCVPKAQGKFSAALTKAGGCPHGGSPQSLVENNCVTPAVTTDGGGTVIDVCPTTTTTTTTSTTTTTTVCGTFVTTWGSFGSGAGQLNQPRGVGVDGSGNVFVGDTGNNRMEKFDNIGTFLTTWGNFGSGDGQLSFPEGVAMDGSGNVFVADTNNNRIQKFDNTGTLLLMFGWGVQDGLAAFETCTSSCQAGILGTGAGQFGAPRNLAVDGSGNVLVGDSNNNRIQKFDNTGTFLFMFGWGVQDGSATFETCTSSCQGGISGNGAGQFDAPRGVAVDGSGNVFVGEFNNNRIQKFDNTGTFLTTWGSLGSGAGLFNLPWGIAVNGSGDVFVADFGNNRIQKFDNTGTFLTMWGSAGSGTGQFAAAAGVAVDGSGNVFVVERDNTRIQKFACP